VGGTNPKSKILEQGTLVVGVNPKSQIPNPKSFDPQSQRGATRFCEVVKLGGLGRLGKRKKLSVIIPTKVLKNTVFFSFLPQLPQLISRRSHFFALLPPKEGY
jgi:hypothetical protein